MQRNIMNDATHWRSQGVHWTICNPPRQTILLKFNSITEYKQANTYLLEHISEMNKFIEVVKGATSEDKFID